MEHTIKQYYQITNILRIILQIPDKGKDNNELHDLLEKKGYVSYKFKDIYELKEPPRQTFYLGKEEDLREYAWYIDKEGNIWEIYQQTDMYQLPNQKVSIHEITGYVKPDIRYHKNYIELQKRSQKAAAVGLNPVLLAANDYLNFPVYK